MDGFFLSSSHLISHRVVKHRSRPSGHEVIRPNPLLKARKDMPFTPAAMAAAFMSGKYQLGWLCCFEPRRFLSCCHRDPRKLTRSSRQILKFLIRPNPQNRKRSGVAGLPCICIRERLS